ncbi:CCHC-type domain-containing protein [Caerostris darwini]|uniref:CCHC-type domain-containing protein n=1 Tax=Caerostris darwini TaxID=1538125 RepID=A0AAV4NTU8_9ARAC|nr:CCHC-type domain-containing protein [Caerostris darwini]
MCGGVAHRSGLSHSFIFVVFCFHQACVSARTFCGYLSDLYLTINSVMEENTSNMDALLKGLLPLEDLLSGILKDANKIMKVALSHYKNIINLADKKNIRTDTRAAFRENAMSLISLFVSQTIQMAQLESRICELEKFKVEATSIQQKSLINETIALAKPSLATVTKNMVNKGAKDVKMNKQIRPTVRPKFLTTIRPMEKDTYSLVTKKVILNAINIKQIKVAVKNVRNISNGGILIETDTEKDLDALIEEFKKKDELTQKFSIAKPVTRKPHIICFNVSTDMGETELTECLRNQFLEDNEQQLEDAFIIKHHFDTKRGVNWIIEVNPTLYAKVAKGKKLNLGWERIGFKEYLRPSQCYKCGKYGHTSTYCKQEKETCTNCGKNDHSWKNCTNKAHCINCEAHNTKFHKHLDTNHGCTSRKCPVQEKERQQISSRTIYG